MNNEEQYSPFIPEGPQITPLSSLPLRGVEYTEIAMTDEGVSLRANPASLCFLNMIRESEAISLF